MRRTYADLEGIVVVSCRVIEKTRAAGAGNAERLPDRHLGLSKERLMPIVYVSDSPVVPFTTICHALLPIEVAVS